MSCPGFHPIRSVFDTRRRATGVRRAAARSLPSADGYPLAGDDLLALLARAAARTLSGTGVLRAFGYPDRPGGGCLVMSRHDLRTEAGR